MINDFLKSVKLKRYPHIGPLISPRDFGRIKGYLTNARAISQHPFLPLIRKSLVSKRYKTGMDGHRKRKDKKRTICYASHLDALIYAFYSYKLGQLYEIKLCECNLSDVVIAYRKIPKGNSGHNKCNIDFARETFKGISEMMAQLDSVSVLVFDIKGFFDSLDHEYVLQAWRSLSNQERLTDDEYAVYKQIVHYHYINEGDLFNLTHNNLKSVRRDGSQCLKSVKEKRYLRANNIVSFCDTDFFKKNKKSKRYVRPGNYNPETQEYLTYGIPQGLPISANIANAYMLPFDQTINEAVRGRGGFYRRYSDDLIVVCESEFEQEILNLVMAKIDERKLSIEKNKTKIFHFTHSEDKILCLRRNQDESYTKVPLEYLGLSFDGNKILLKSASVNRFYVKMHKALKCKQRWAIHGSQKRKGKLFLNHVYPRFTIKGTFSYPLKQVKNPQTKKTKLVRDYSHKSKHGGNYLSYVWRASGKNVKSPIYQQLHSSRAILEREIKIAKEKITQALTK